MVEMDGAELMEISGIRLDGRVTDCVMERGQTIRNLKGEKKEGLGNL